MAFDFGAKRTGVALGQEITASARPLATIKSVNNQPNWPAIESLVTEWQPTQFIVGIPAECDENKALRSSIDKFSCELERRFNLPVQLHDETLTSNEAYVQLKTKHQRLNRVVQGTDEHGVDVAGAQGGTNN